MDQTRVRKIGLVSLGCAKALSDSERILSRLRAEGYEISSSYKGADVVVVNTCGFIDSAIDESLHAIGEALAENGKVIVTGCLGTRSEVIKAAHPNVLAITGPSAPDELFAAIHRHVPQPHDRFLSLIPPHGIRLTPRHYAYLKISEGCNHRCTFCVIPQLRGGLVSRPVGDVLREAENLVKAGVKELLVISQDTSAYGVDVKYRTGFWRGRPVPTRMTELVRALADFGVWVRLHYVYPYPHVDEVIPLMSEGKVLPYLDVPFQHASARILRLMKRPANGDDNLERIRKWRQVCPDLAIRSTFIVGFPGETAQDFEELLAFLREADLDRVGCFEYSAVEGAQANQLPGAVPEDIKQERRAQLMALQEEISRRKLKKKIGAILTVLIEEVNGVNAIARTSADAPEIDGVVHVQGLGLQVGQFARVKITGADAHDLRGNVVSGELRRAAASHGR